MKLLWESERPLSCTEIVQNSSDKTWKDSYVHSIIKSLMKKEMVKIAGFELASRSYARTFTYTMTEDEYLLDFILSAGGAETMNKVIALYVERMENREDLDTLAEIIRKKKRSLK